MDILKKIQKINMELKNKWILPKDFNFAAEIQLLKKVAIEKFNFDFVFDEYNLPIIEILIMYFNNIKSIDTIVVNLNKGIILAGSVGTGKSKIMQLFSHYGFIKQLEKKFKFERAVFMIDQYSTGGNAEINTYLYNIQTNGYNYKVRKPFNLCIDDIGLVDEEAMYFGNRENVIAKILFTRYDFLELNILTHATTNIEVETMKQKYGERLYSRFREMFNFIHLDGNDRRK
jgi:DNA replication protein DnaC